MLDIKTSGTDWRCDHNASDTILKILDGKFTILLILTSMEDKCLIADLIKLFEKLISFNLLVHEDKDTSLVIMHSNEFHEAEEFIIRVGNHFDELLDVRASLSTVTYNYLDRRMKDLFSKVFDLLREGGWEHHTLLIRSHVLQDSTDLWLKSHIKHSIGLIKYDIAAPL